MKKLIFALLIGLLLLFALCACNQSDDNESTTPENTTESVSPDTTTSQNTNSDYTDSEKTTLDGEETTNSNIDNVTLPDDTLKYERSPELDEAFSLIEQDVLENEKLSFEIGDEELHFELKNSGRYDDDNWIGSYFLIIVYCDYATAFDEEWYQNAIELSSITFNEALYNYYELHGQFSDLQFMEFEGLYIMYESREEFLADYSVVKSFSDSRCVTKVSISYKYSLPRGHLID